jgi:hypothetical protein
MRASDSDSCDNSVFPGGAPFRSRMKLMISV